MLDFSIDRDDRTAISAILGSYSMGGFSDMQGQIVVWRDNDELVGCASCSFDSARKDAWLNCVAVKSTHRRQGIGKKMVCHFIDTLFPNHDIWLETAFWNKRFYTSLGFEWIPIKDIGTYYILDPRARKTTMVMAMVTYGGDLSRPLVS
jgi:ribosomal protein S18 acetylase RimI-like enzyme